MNLSECKMSGKSKSFCKVDFFFVAFSIMKATLAKNETTHTHTHNKKKQKETKSGKENMDKETNTK